MINQARITERGIDAKVIHIIPRKGVRGQAQVEVREEEKLGCRCPDYVLEGRLKELHGLRRKKVISVGEFNEMYFEVVDEDVNAPQNQEYVHEFKALISKHQKYLETLNIENQLEEIYTLREKYQ